MNGWQLLHDQRIAAIGVDYGEPIAPAQINASIYVDLSRKILPAQRSRSNLRNDLA